MKSRNVAQDMFDQSLTKLGDISDLCRDMNTEFTQNQTGAQNSHQFSPH